MNGPCVLERSLELRQTLSLFRLRDGFVGLERRDLLLDLVGRLGELLRLWVDAGHDHRDIHRCDIIFVEARKAVLLGNSPRLRLHLWIRFVWICAVVELRHVLGGGHEALDMLLGELDLLTSCAVTAPGLNRARARKDENNAPRNAPPVDTACPFRLSDMAWSSISIHPLHPIILTAA